jgi:hypothetical protein
MAAQEQQNRAPGAQPEKDAAPAAQSEQNQTPGAQSQEDADQATEGAAQQVQESVDQETDQGFRGVEVDMTPNENYTVEGVTSGADVPETAENPPEARREATNPDAAL